MNAPLLPLQEHLARVSAGSRCHLGCTSAQSRLHLDCIPARSRHVVEVVEDVPGLSSNPRVVTRPLKLLSGLLVGATAILRQAPLSRRWSPPCGLGREDLELGARAARASPDDHVSCPCPYFGRISAGSRPQLTASHPSPGQKENSTSLTPVSARTDACELMRVARRRTSTHCRTSAGLE